MNTSVRIVWTSRRLFDAPSFTKCNRQILRTITSLRNQIASKNNGLIGARVATKRTLYSQILRPYVDPSLSYAFGRSSENLIYSTVAREFERQLDNRPDDLAYVCFSENKEVTLRQLDVDVNKLSKALVQRYGVQRGDFIGVYAYNSYNWIVAQFACSRIGAILTPINPSYKTDELAYILKKGKVKVLFMPGPKSVQNELNDHLKVLQSDKIVDMSKGKELVLEHVILMDDNIEYDISREHRSSEGLRIKPKLSNCDIHNWNDTFNDGLVFKSAQEAEDAGLNLSDACILSIDEQSPEDTYAVYYTSGTTGKPKGACVSQFTVINNVRFCQLRLRHGRQRDWRATCSTVLPLFHIFAGVLNVLSPVINNTLMVFPSYKYDLKSFVDSILKYQANLTTLTPTILIDLLTYVETNGLTDFPLRTIQSGGAALSPEVVSRAYKILPNIEEIRTGYGSTENGSVATFQTIHEPAETRAHSVGPPLDFSEIRIVKPNTDEVLLHGQKGEIQTRGYNTMLEYLDEPDKTDEVITTSKWYRTGDLGFMHPHGSLQISGRVKHMIIKGGENIYPEEVEQLIHKLDYVEDVHVVGVPDERFGEQVCAWIKLKPGFRGVERATGDEERDRSVVSKEEIIKYCQDNITYFKVPKYLLFVDDFPLTPTKKVQAHIMSERSCEILGLRKVTAPE